MGKNLCYEKKYLDLRFFWFVKCLGPCGGQAIDLAGIGVQNEVKKNKFYVHLYPLKRNFL